MVRPLVAAGIVAISAMVAVAAMPPRVSPKEPRRSPSDVVRTGSTRTIDASQSVTTAAQGRTGTLKGHVHDAAGNALPGAVVAASHEVSGWQALALADRKGMFVIDRVPAGDITLVIRRGALEFSKVVTVLAGRDTALVVQQDSTAARPPWASGGATGVAPVPMSPPPNVARSMLAQRVGVAREAMSADAVSTRVDPFAGPTSMDGYARIDPSGYRRVADAPFSTFSIDVDTASYTNVRRFLMEGELPPADAVRVEEWVNYFPYAYPTPEGRDVFRVSTALTGCPWNPAHQLLRVGVRGRPLPAGEPPARNLVFLVDVSGSMMPKDRLPLVKTALRMLADQLTARDRIALVVYAGSTGLVLPSTPGDQRARIHDALQRLEAGGSTNGAGGITLAYATAHDGFIKGGVNRVVLATDGDFNVGLTSLGDLTRLIEQERARGVFLSVLGVGRGNLKDATLEQLADRGNGNYAYIDSLQEARRVLVEQVGATIVTIAKDVKLQIEFNPRHVGAYRLVGYENRTLQAEDFANDARDAGEIGAGHTVTALYEIVPPSRVDTLPGATAMRYQQPSAPRGGHEDELATISVRHKLPDGDKSVLESHTVTAGPTAADLDTAFASAVAEAALVLRKDPFATGASLAGAIGRARAHVGADPGGWRAEFVRLMQVAQGIDALKVAPTSEP